MSKDAEKSDYNIDPGIFGGNLLKQLGKDLSGLLKKYPLRWTSGCV
jgi:hypothetical protein